MPKRMIHTDVFTSDAFIAMPIEAQALYSQLYSRADSSGFVSAIVAALRSIGVEENAFTELVKSGFVINFDSGVCVIKHWFVGNELKNDRKVTTSHKHELNMVDLDDNNVYHLKHSLEENGIQILPNSSKLFQNPPNTTQSRASQSNTTQSRASQSMAPQYDIRTGQIHKYDNTVDDTDEDEPF